jgi:hypothetical protein
LGITFDGISVNDNRLESNDSSSTLTRFRSLRFRPSLTAEFGQGRVEIKFATQGSSNDYHGYGSEFIATLDNIETTFHMIKSKFGQRLRSKSLTAQINEALCKVLCHNLCVVIQSMHELNITPEFQMPLENVKAAKKCGRLGVGWIWLVPLSGVKLALDRWYYW